VTFLGVAILLSAVAATAGYLPARRASRINPIVALRQISSSSQQEKVSLSCVGIKAKSMVKGVKERLITFGTRMTIWRAFQYPEEARVSEGDERAAGEIHLR